MTQFYIIRHAQSENNTLHQALARTFDNNFLQVRPLEARKRHQDAPLSAMGEQQAEALALYLPTLVQGKTVVVCSPMRRAIQTIVPSISALPNAEFWCHGKLYEVGGCYKLNRAYPGLTSAELENYFSKLLQVPSDGWYAEHDTRETLPALKKRVELLYRWLLSMRDSGYDTVILVSHGACMAQLISRILGTELCLIAHANTGFTQFLWDAQKGFLLRAINRIAHIPPSLLSGDGLEDGWWPTQKEWTLHIARLDTLPVAHPKLYAETVALRETHLLSHEGLKADAYQEIDVRSIHFLAFKKSALLGMVQYDPQLNRIRQLLVLPEARRQGIGRQLIQAVQREVPSLKVHAWQTSQAFYAQCGFIPEGEPYLSNGIWCQRMGLRSSV